MAEVTAAKTSLLHSLVTGSGKIAIVSHTHPDGDALGSTTAMQSYLRECCGKESVIVLPSPVPDSLSFLSGPGMIDAVNSPQEASALIADCDLLICLDFNVPSRTAGLEKCLRDCRARKVLIDHHKDPEREMYDLVFSITEISSACEVLYNVLLQMPEIGGSASRLPRRCAYSLMAGMTTDTNNFANSVYPGTLEMASALLAAGVDRDGIVTHVFQEYRENRLRALGWALSEKMKISPEGVAYMIFTEEDLQRFDLQEGETEGFVNQALAIKSVRMSLLLKQEGDGMFRVSVRSKRGTSANAAAKGWFHGGGHELASGGKLYWPADIPSREGAEEYILAMAARLMQSQGRTK